MSLNFDDLAPHLAGITESVARAVIPLSAKGKKDEADHIAVETMRSGLGKLPVRMHILLGEGEKDNAPMLYTGERFGSGDGPILDLIVDPLECTTNFSKGLADSMSVILAVPEGFAQELPGTYMQQILVQGGAASVIDAASLDADPKELLGLVADEIECRPGDITVVVQDRPRHKALIEGIRAAGAGIALIESGSISAGVELALHPEGRLTMLWGTFGAPEGLILAFIASITGAAFFGRVIPHDEASKERARSLGVENRVLSAAELVKGPGILSMSAIHSSTWMRGVTRTALGGRRVETLVLGNGQSQRMVHEDGRLVQARAFA